MSAHRTTPRTDLARRLAQCTLDLVNIESVSRNEAALAQAVTSLTEPIAPSVVHDDSLFFAPARRPGVPLVVFAGHLDTVPPQDNLPGRIDDGSVHGLGASDMKGALAVMVEMIRWLERDDPDTSLDCGFLFFAREELPIDASPITGLLEAAPELRDASLVVIMEPTANAIQLGCLGNLNADVTYRGASSHSARPWLGDNAIHGAIRGLQKVAGSTAREVTVDGLGFYEVVNVTGIDGGIARNIIPDEVVCHLNFRYAPNRMPDEAEAELRSLIAGDATLSVIGNASPGRVATDNELVERLRAAGDAALEPKQAWTNVAEFTAVGIDAVNFGPGAPEYAHRADEQVSIDALAVSFGALQRFVLGTQ